MPFHPFRPFRPFRLGPPLPGHHFPKPPPPRIPVRPDRPLAERRTRPAATVDGEIYLPSVPTVGDPCGLTRWSGSRRSGPSVAIAEV
jgi:hypothetical protein